MTDEELRVADGSDEAALAGGAEGPLGAVEALPVGGADDEAEAAVPPSVLAGIGAEAPQPAHPSASTADVLALIDRLEDLLERSDLA